jgi:hypothetical protein
MTRRDEVIQNLQVSLREYKLKGGVSRALIVAHDARALLEDAWNTFFKRKPTQAQRVNALLKK